MTPLDTLVINDQTAMDTGSYKNEEIVNKSNINEGKIRLCRKDTGASKYNL